MAERPQLYLVTTPLADAGEATASLKAALEREPVAAVLLRLAPAEERARINLVKELAKLAQTAGAALIVEDDTVAAMRGGADGVHVTTGIEALREAIARMKPERIVGAGDLRSRHAAMEAGEAGADYVMFGEPSGERPLPSLAAVEERARWWAEVFEIPGVAYAPDGEAARKLARTGIEFIARPLGDATGTPRAIDEGSPPPHNAV